jgi:hypothetical protein
VKFLELIILRKSANLSAVISENKKIQFLFPQIYADKKTQKGADKRTLKTIHKIKIEIINKYVIPLGARF